MGVYVAESCVFILLVEYNVSFMNERYFVCLVPEISQMQAQCLLQGRHLEAEFWLP